MPRLKRTRDEAGLDLPQEAEATPQQNETLIRLRNMWEFASLMQYIYLFGSIVKIEDDLDIEDLEAECLSATPSQRLAQIGLQFLKYISSHRGLNLDIFDEYTRRQYVAKAPTRNPFGEEEEPARFHDFDVFTKIRVLHQLTMWTLINADRFRAVAPQEDDQTLWRMEPLGWDKDDCSYFVLDDNRLYRRSDVPIPPPSPPKPKSKAKKRKTALKKKSSRPSRGKPTRASKRLKIEHDDDSDEEMEDDDALAVPEDEELEETLVEETLIEADDEPGYGFTSKTWQCIAITLEDYQTFLAGLARTRDPNEKQLRKRIEDDVMPIIEKRAEQLRQKELKKIRELENLQKLATAKRSSRLADKADREKEEREKIEAQEKHERELRMAREEEARQRRIEEGHESRRQTREQRLKERETKRILHQEALDRLQEQEDRASSQDLEADGTDGKRVSNRQTKAQREQLEKELAGLAEDDDNKWYFDCSKCGMHGENLDDGSHSIACDKCNVWQHSKCHNIAPEQAEKEGFTFICQSCKRKEEDAKRPKPTIKIARSSAPNEPDTSTTLEPAPSNGPVSHLKGVYIPTIQSQKAPTPKSASQLPSSSPGSTKSSLPPVSNFAPRPEAQKPSQSSKAERSSVPLQQHHQQQHDSAHQHAVAAAGGHPGYQHTHTQPGQENGSSLNGHASSHPTSPSSHHKHNHRQEPGQFMIHQYQPAAKQPNPAHILNGGSSPIKQTAPPIATPPRQFTRPVSQHSNAPAPSFHLPHSPKTTFAPPSSSFSQNGHSPVKSSPPPSHQEPRSQQPYNPSNSFTQTPQTLRPLAADARVYETPRAFNEREGIVAGGMSGPWPEGSKVIPQKHDQSPAPPSSSQAINEKRILPPFAALAPSPSHHAQTGADSIPVKKLPEDPVRSPASNSSQPIDAALPDIRTPTPATGQQPPPSSLTDTSSQ